MTKIIAIDWKGSSSFIGSTQKGKEYISNSDVGLLERTLQSIVKVDKIFHSINLNSSNVMKEIERFINNNYQLGDILISKDHLITYFGIKVIRNIIKKPLGLIVIDQHSDICSYRTHGKKLNKANIFRISIDKNLIDYIVFLGIRPSEEALHNIPDVDVPEFDRQFSEKYRKKGIHSTLDSKISIIPSYKFKTLREGIVEALDILKQKGIHHVGLDFDLDAFDSDIIRGVDYTRNFAMAIYNNYLKSNCEQLVKSNSKFKKEINFLLKISEPYDANRVYFESELYKLYKLLIVGNVPEDLILNTELALWFSSQLSQKGISPILEDNLREILLETMKRNKQNLVYRGITEFEPYNDANNNTIILINNLIAIIK